MPLRLLEVSLPESDAKDVRELIAEDSIYGFWREKSSEDHSLVKILLSVEQTERVLDVLEHQYSGLEGFRVVVLPVEATIPRIEEKKTEPKKVDDQKTEQAAKEKMRISREELHSDIVDSTKLNSIYVAMVILSAVVAAVGLLQDSVAIIIGAMVIAPLLGPNVGLALATTLGDKDLGWNVLKTNAVGVSIALAFAFVIGMVFPIDPQIGEIQARTYVALPDIAVALASGVAGVLAFTSGASMALIGVMVAVALMPPLIVLGLLLGSGHTTLALGAFFLLTTNIICVNLAGVTTFWVQGVRPRSWWEATGARKATRLAVLVWSLLLIILILVILYTQRQDVSILLN
jgi:uncharacterized hydrophobic protein (TIGR00341 family)